MADCGMAFQAANNIGIVEGCINEPEGFVRKKILAVIRYNTTGFLPTVLQSVESKRSQCSGIFRAENTENAEEFKKSAASADSAVKKVSMITIITIANLIGELRKGCRRANGFVRIGGGRTA